MAIPYAGGTRVNYTFTDAGTRADLVSKLETQLGTAGWSTISGGGSGDVLMKSAVTQDGLSIRLRLYDPGAGNCAQFTIKNNAGTLTSSIGYLLPASAQWRIVANKYQFFYFRTGAANRVLPRGILMGGTIWVPANILAAMVGDLDCGWLVYNGTTDTDAAARPTMRDRLFASANSGAGSTLYTSWMVNHVATPTSAPCLGCIASSFDSTAALARWQDNTAPQSEAFIAWGSTSAAGGESKFKGQLWDAMVVQAAVDGESTITFDGHTFLAITDQNASREKGTLYLAVT